MKRPRIKQHSGGGAHVSIKFIIQRRIRVCHATIVGILSLSGCDTAPTRPASPETVHEAVQSINASLSKATLLNEADLLSEEHGYRFETVRKVFRDKQCAAAVANPVLLIARPTKISLRGTFDESGNVRLSESVTKGASTTGNAISENSFEVPLRVSTIADLPNEYLKDMTSLLETKGLPVEISEKLKKELPQNYEKLKARVARLVNDFNPTVCAKLVAQRAPSSQSSAIIFVPPTY
jgi:hypothetical protein